MLTAAEFERLPEILQDIVVADREIAVFRDVLASPIVSLHYGRRFRAHRALRAEMSAAASHSWGHRLGGDGAAS